MQKFIIIGRDQMTDKQTIGRLYVLDEQVVHFKCSTMEKPWLNNQRGISCIPAGEYTVQKHVSPKFGHCFMICDVPGRQEILIHPGNFVENTHGCVLPGYRSKDINADGLVDVIDSRICMAKLMELMPDKFILKIFDNDEAENITWCPSK